MNLDFSATIPQIPFILEGLAITLKIVVVSAIIGLILGIVLSLCKISTFRPFIWIADFYTSVFRGTPLVLQLMIVYFAFLSCSDFKLTSFGLRLSHCL